MLYLRFLLRLDLNHFIWVFLLLIFRFNINLIHYICLFFLLSFQFLQSLCLLLLLLLSQLLFFDPRLSYIFLFLLLSFFPLLSFFFFSLTHFDNSLHHFLFLFLLLLLLILDLQRNLHSLFDQRFFSLTLSLRQLTLLFFSIFRSWKCLLLSCCCSSWLSWFMLRIYRFPWKHLQSLLVQLSISLNHKLFERIEIFHSSDLINNLFMQRIRTSFITCIRKLFFCYS